MVFEAMCNITGFPLSNVFWNFNNEPISSHRMAVLSDNAGVAGGRLLIYDLSRGDIGRYTCKVEVRGRVTGNFMLEEHGNSYFKIYKTVPSPLCQKA